MTKAFLKWFIILLLSFIVSTFLHEIGHGISSAAVGVHVSTGFNRVGQVYKKPHDADFRKGLENYENPWDMGPNTTLILAIGFTLALTKIKTKNQTALIIVGAVALGNSLIRLVPMIHSYLGFVIKGSPYMEDEIGTGEIWYKLGHLGILKYAPSMISIIVSVLCLYFVIKNLKTKLPILFSKRIYFTLILVFAYILSFIVENRLDNILRINWV